MNSVCELVFKDREGQIAVFSEAVMATLLQYRQLNDSALEAAGVLIGERRGDHLVICDLSIPGSGDYRSRCRVDRKGKHHQRKVIDCFNSSGGYLQYLGEWHTHPEDRPLPSSQDQESWMKHLSATNPMIVAIVGRESLWVGKKIFNTISKMEGI